MIVRRHDIVVSLEPTLRTAATNETDETITAMLTNRITRWIIRSRAQTKVTKKKS